MELLVVEVGFPIKLWSVMCKCLKIITLFLKQINLIFIKMCEFNCNKNMEILQNCPIYPCVTPLYIVLCFYSIVGTR